MGKTAASTANWSSNYGMSGESLRLQKISWSYDPANPFLGIWSKNWILDRYSTCSGMFTAVLFIIPRKWKQPTQSANNDWITTVWFTYTGEYYSVEKKNEAMNFAGKERI